MTDTAPNQSIDQDEQLADAGQLPERWALFVDALFANGFRGADAARAAGYKGKNVKITAYKLRQHPVVKAAIEARFAELEEDPRFRSQAILHETAQVAYMKPSESTMASKVRALELLGKYRELWTDKLKHGVGGSLEEMLRQVVEDEPDGDGAPA